MVEIQIYEDFDLFELDIALFKTNYPELYKQHKSELSDLSYDEIDEIIPLNDSALDLVTKKKLISIYLANGKKEYIFNTDVLPWYSLYVDSSFIKCDSQYVYLFLSPADGQAGGLGIWSIDKKDWIFDYYDEGFCVEEIIHSDKLDLFVGYNRWNIPMTPQGGEKFFVIENNEYKEVVAEKGSVYSSIDDLILIKSKLSTHDTGLYFDADKLIIYLKSEKEKITAYKYKPESSYLTTDDLIKCGETRKSLDIENSPKNVGSYYALSSLIKNILDPVVEYFGDVKLTYGFCSLDLSKQIPGKISPKIDQHCAHELDSKGNLICSRGGAACDFYIDGISSLLVAKWIAKNTLFDRLYYYGVDVPLHVSYGPDHSRQIVVMSEGPSGKLIPKVVKEL